MKQHSRIVRILCVTCLTALVGCASHPRSKKNIGLIQSDKDRTEMGSTLSCQDTFSVIDFTEIEYSNIPQKLSEFADSIAYIRLDNEPVIPDAWNNAVVVSDDNIFIDSELIYKYNLDGKFVLSLFQKGYGHREAVKYTRGIYNFDKKYVAFRNNVGEFYNVYSFNGDFVGFQNCKEDEDVNDKFDGEDAKGSKKICAYIDNIQAYCYNYKSLGAKINTLVNPNGPVLLYAKDMRNDSVVYKLKNYHFDSKALEKRRTTQSVNYPVDCGSLDSAFWVRPVFLDTIYRTSDFKSVRPWYVLKQKSTAADYECKLRAMMGDDGKELNREGVWVVYALEDGILFGYDAKKVSGIGYCKAGGKAKTFSESFENDLDGFLKKLTIPGLKTNGLYTKNGYLYMLVRAEEFLTEGAKSPFPDLTKDSNPVVVKLRLKKKGCQ